MFSRRTFFIPPPSATLKPPMPYYHERNVEDVINHHNQTLPKMQLPIPQKHNAKSSRNDKKPDIPNETLPRDVKRSNESHTPTNHRRNKPRRPEQLAHSQAPTIRTHRRKSGKNIRTPIPKRQERNTGHTLTQPKHRRDGTQVYAEEVTSRYADGGEQQAEPRYQDQESDRFDVGEFAVVEV